MIAPLIGSLLSPFFEFTYKTLHVDPSIISASLFANDMGGASLSKGITRNESIGMFNALVVSSMMGATVSFTIPLAVGVVGKEKHKEMFLGFLCGIVTIPIGCFISGLLCGISIVDLLLNILPLLILSLIIAFGLVKAPNICVKIFKAFAKCMTVVIIIGLLMGIINYMMDRELIKGIAPIEDGVF